MTLLPSRIVAGDSLTFTVQSFSDDLGNCISQSTGWALSISFRGNGNTLDVTADSTWTFTISPTQTSTLIAGSCFFQLYATNAGTSQRITANRGQVTVLPNLSTANGSVEGRSQTRIDLESVQSLIRQLIATGGVVEYRIAGRLGRKYELSELRIEESKLLARLAREERADRIKNGQGDPHSLYVRFK